MNDTEICTRCKTKHKRANMTPFLNDTWLCNACIPAAEEDIIREVERREKLN